MRRNYLFALCLVLSFFLIACSGSKSTTGNNPPPSSVNVTPSTITLNKGGMQAFSADVVGSQDQTVFWEIVGASPLSGDTAHGFISNAGVYVAPTTLPNPPSVTVKALSASDPSKSGSATVTLQAGSNTSVVINQGPSSVSTFSTLQFTVTVSGNTNQNVTWQVNGAAGGGPTTGAISATGLFTAPNSVPVLTSGNNSGQTSQVLVTAISVADTTASDSVLVTIAPPQQNAQGANSPLGVSGGNAKDTSMSGGSTFCCGGTLGSLVTRGGTSYILSNNHVLALSDAGTQGDNITQPGLIDNNCAVPPTVATLSQFYNLETGSAPHIDAALAQITAGAIDSSGTILQLGGTNNGSQPTNGQPHQGNGVSATIGQAVAKSGRSTGLTCSTVFAVNADISVEYQKGCGTGSTFTTTFTNQVDINGFSAEGDSGSLIVTQTTADPIGLLYAGTSTDTVANPVSQVLSGLADPHNAQSLPTFVGSATTHAVAACNLPGPQSVMAAKMALQKIVASAEALANSTSVRDAHSAELMKYPEVQAVGVGASYDNPSEAAILLFVTRGQPHSDLPMQVQGIRTRIIEGELFSQKGVLSAAESATLEQSATPPQLVYPISSSELGRAERVRVAHSSEWMKKSGVQGVGIGSSSDSPDEAALIVFLIKGVQHDAIPPVIDGLRTRIRESERIRAGSRQERSQHGCSVNGAVKPQTSVPALAASQRSL